MNLYEILKSNVLILIDTYGLDKGYVNNPKAEETDPYITSNKDDPKILENGKYLGSNTYYTNFTAKCSCKCPIQIQNDKSKEITSKLEVICEINFKANIVLFTGQPKLENESIGLKMPKDSKNPKYVTLSRIYGHEQAHVESARAKVLSELRRRMNAGEFDPSNKKEDCSKRAQDFENTLPSILEAFLKTQTGGNKDHDTDTNSPAPSAGEPIEPKSGTKPEIILKLKNNEITN